MDVQMKKKTLLNNWLKLKEAEGKAKVARHAVESEIEKFYTFTENSKTFKEEDIKFSVKIQKSESVKLDQETYSDLRITLPENLRPEKIKYELDKTGYEYLKKNEKDIYNKVSKCVTITPGKSTIKVEKIKGGKR